MWLSMSYDGSWHESGTSIEFGSGHDFMLSVMGVWGQTGRGFRVART